MVPGIIPDSGQFFITICRKEQIRGGLGNEIRIKEPVINLIGGQSRHIKDIFPILAAIQKAEIAARQNKAAHGDNGKARGNSRIHENTPHRPP